MRAFIAGVIVFALLLSPFLLLYLVDKVGYLRWRKKHYPEGEE